MVVALPYVRMGEAALAAPVPALGVLLFVQGTGEAGPGGVSAPGWGGRCSYAHQSRKQTGLLWCHGGWGSGWGERLDTWKLWQLLTSTDLKPFIKLIFQVTFTYIKLLKRLRKNVNS